MIQECQKYNWRCYYELDNLGVWISGGARDFSQKLIDEIWGPSSFLLQGYLELFHQGWSGRQWGWPLTSLQCQDWMKLCLCSFYMPSWHLWGCLYLLLWKFSFCKTCMLCSNGMLTNIILTPCSRKCGQCCHPTAGCSWCCWSHRICITRWCWRPCGIGSVIRGCHYDCCYNCCGCVGKSNILCSLEYSQDMSITYIWGRSFINMVGLRKDLSCEIFIFVLLWTSVF